MKKALLTITLAAFAFAANAQFIVGGQIGFNTTGGNDNVAANSFLNTDEYSVPNTQFNGLTIAPVFSYVINDNMQVGIQIAYTWNSTKTFVPAAYVLDKEAWTKDVNSTFGIAPYFRYYFANADKFNFFCEAQLGWNTTSRGKTTTFSNMTGTDVTTETTGNTKFSSVAFTIVPGVNYRISEKFSADLYIDLAGLYFNHNTIKTYGALTANGWDDDMLVDTDVTNDFGLFANASAQSINAHLGIFRLGFNYHF